MGHGCQQQQQKQQPGVWKARNLWQCGGDRRQEELVEGERVDVRQNVGLEASSSQVHRCKPVVISSVLHILEICYIYSLGFIICFVFLPINFIAVDHLNQILCKSYFTTCFILYIYHRKNLQDINFVM